MMEWLAWVIGFAFCWDKSRKIYKMFCCSQIAPGIEIFSDKKCKVTFGFEYMFVLNLDITTYSVHVNAYAVMCNHRGVSLPWLLFYAPNFKEVDGAYWFRIVLMKSNTCHILRTVRARVLKIYIWIPHGKLAVRVISLSRVMPLWKNQNEILSARYLKKYMS